MVDLESGRSASPTDTVFTVGQEDQKEAKLSDQTLTPAEDEFPEGGLQAWLTVTGAFLVQYATFGYINAFGVYQDYYVRVYLTNYTPSEIGWIGGAQVFFIFATGIFARFAVDRGYLHHLMVASTFLQALALFTLSVTHQNQYYQVFLAQSVCLGVSSGLVFIPTLSIVSQYFLKKRPLALGIVSAGSGLGAILHPIMLNRLFSGSFGFYNGVRASGVLNTALLLIATFMIKTRLTPKKADKLPIKEYLVDPAYVCLVLGSIMVFFGIFYPTFQLQLNAVTHGIDPNFSFYLVSIMNAASIFGRTLPPMLSQRLGIVNLLIVFTALTGVVACTMSTIHDVAGTTLFALAYGFCSGGVISMTTSAVASTSRNLSEIGARLAVLYALSGIVGMCSSPIAGALLTDNLHWKSASLFAGIMMAASSLFVIAGRWFIVRRKGTPFV